MSDRITRAGDDITGVVVASPTSSLSTQVAASVMPSNLLAVASVGVDSTIGRRVLREERRKRQRVAIICGLVVAACLAMTVFILGMARDRPTRVAPVGASVLITHLSPIDQNPPIPGALAPERGHR